MAKKDEKRRKKTKIVANLRLKKNLFKKKLFS